MNGSEEKKQHCKHVGCDKTYVSLRYLRIHEAKEHNCPPECKLCEEQRNRRRKTRAMYDEDVPVLITIHPDLAFRLMDDNDKMTNNTYLIALPRTPNVHELIDEFAATQPPDVAQLAKSLLPLFCRMVGPFLLYEIEKKQYAQVLDRVTAIDELSNYYGAEHLLRLIVKLPKIAADIKFKDFDQLKVLLESLAAFLQTNSTRVFCSHYFRINPNQTTIE